MFRGLFDWTLSLIGISRDLAECRASIKELSKRVRDLEEAFKLLSLQVRHAQEREAHEREKLVLRLENVVAKQLPPPKPRKKSE